jgi:hypothetical protein
MLAKQLVARGITLDPAVKKRLTDRLWARGNREFDRLQDEIGSDISCFKAPCILSLGVGAGLTEFAVSGVSLTSEGLAALTTLGGLVILIVSAFDSALDQGIQLPALFPLNRRTEYADSGQQEALFIRGAVQLYYKRLASLPQTRPQIRQMVEKAIERMYAAELESVADREISRRAWWRKNTLPIAILGIPAWMIADECTGDGFRRHLAWLCRLGEFFGWLDDCVDYDEDLVNAHANRINLRLRSMSPSRLVQNIAWQAERVLSHWDAVNHAASARDYFAVVIWGWIERDLVNTLS